jgi:hypothetical protein
MLPRGTGHTTYRLRAGKLVQLALQRSEALGPGFTGPAAITPGSRPGNGFFRIWAARAPDGAKGDDPVLGGRQGLRKRRV